MKSHRPELGEIVAVVWEKENGTACGGTEGFVMGIVGDETSGEYLILDRSTYQDSFKSNLLSLDILDLRVIPMDEVKSVERVEMRQRPPNTHEKFTLKIEVNYRSNIDFESTWNEVRKRIDCKVGPIRKADSEALYGMTIKQINAIEGASITISATGTIQIFCKNLQLDDCIRWIQEAVELWPDHKRLVLFPMKVTYSINDTYKEEARPTEEVIDRFAVAEKGPPVVFPIGWAHRFFVELDENPLQELFPGCTPLEDYVIKDENKEKEISTRPAVSDKSKPRQTGDPKVAHSDINATRYLGAISPVIRLRGGIDDLSSEFVDFMIQRWQDMRSGPWQWFSSDQIKGKMVVRDLNLDKKDRTWTLDLRKHSSSAEL